MKKENKIVVFVKEHKVEVIAVASAVVGLAGYMGIVTLIGNKQFKPLEIPQRYHKLDTAWLKTKGKNKGAIFGNSFRVPVKELGEFGEKLLSIEGIKDTDDVRLMWGIEGFYGT